MVSRCRSHYTTVSGQKVGEWYGRPLCAGRPDSGGCCRAETWRHPCDELLCAGFDAHGSEALLGRTRTIEANGAGQEAGGLRRRPGREPTSALPDTRTSSQASFARRDGLTRRGLYRRILPRLGMTMRECRRVQIKGIIAREHDAAHRLRARSDWGMFSRRSLQMGWPGAGSAHSLIGS